MADMLGDAEDRNLIRTACDVLERFPGMDLFVRTRSNPSERLLEVAPSKAAKGRHTEDKKYEDICKSGGE